MAVAFCEALKQVFGPAGNGAILHWKEGGGLLTRLCQLGLRLIPERVVRICAVYDLCQKNDRWITCEFVLFHQYIERALLAVVSKLDALVTHFMLSLLLHYAPSHFLELAERR